MTEAEREIMRLFDRTPYDGDKIPFTSPLVALASQTPPRSARL